MFLLAYAILALHVYYARERETYIHHILYNKQGKIKQKLEFRREVAIYIGFFGPLPILKELW